MSELAAAVVGLGAQLYFDVSPLFDEHWTGIPTVAAGLADALLSALPHHTSFFYRQDLVATEAVVDALRRESGLYLERNYHRGHIKIGPVPLASGNVPMVGIYPSVKLERSLFPIECSIYHDLSTLILPQYHTSENVRNHLIGMSHDIATNAVNFGVSAATVSDMINYLGASPANTFVLENGHSWPWWFSVQDSNDRELSNHVPYYLVLGTREPRKNLSCLFDALSISPEILDGARLLIVGKDGWLNDYPIRPTIRKMIDKGQIVFTGFLSNFEKYQLLRGAEATIYPSLFEGFGLPVLESISVGTPCIASWSSSIPEVGGAACTYFDPLCPEELAAAMVGFTQLRTKQCSDFKFNCLGIMEAHTSRFIVDQLLSKIVPVIEARMTNPERV